MNEIKAEIEQVQSYIGRGQDTIRVMARYEAAGTIGSLTMDFPSAAARDLYVGRILTVTVAFAEEARS